MKMKKLLAAMLAAVMMLTMAFAFAEETVEQPVPFTARIGVSMNPSAPILGEELTLKADVEEANMGYSIAWEKLTKDEEENDIWVTVAGGNEMRMTASASVAGTVYRAVVTGADGTVLVAGSITIPTPQNPEPAPAEESIEEVTAAEESTEEIPAEEELVEEESAEEVPAEEEPAAEEPAEEIPEEGTPAEEEPVEEVPAEEEPAAEEPAEETPAEEQKIIEEETPKVAKKASEYVFIDEYGTPLGLEDLNLVPVIVTSIVDVRVDPDGLSPIFVTLEEGEEVQVICKVDDWYEVLVGDEIGYIYKDALEESDAEAEEIDAEEEKVVEVEKKVTIFTSRRTVMTEGETVYLTSKLEGFEGYEVAYKWQCDQGEGYQYVEGANEDTYEYTADTETLSWGWRLLVYYR